MRRITILFAVLAVFLWVAGETVTHADTFTFTDNTIYWGDGNPGWSSGAWDSDDSPGWSSDYFSPDDDHDVIGDPDITGGGGTIDTAGHLTEIYFNYSTWGLGLAPGDLFIDIRGDMTWEYVVTPEGAVYSVPSISAQKPAPWDSSKDFYQDSNEVFGWSHSDSWDWRNDHPVKADFNYIKEISTASDNDTSTAATFSNLSIDLLGKDFIIAWAPTCANDVVYEKIPNPVPEPATMLLLGVGLCGLAFVGRKKLIKQG